MIPQNLLLASVNEACKFAHVASKTTFLRFAQNGGYFFDKASEMSALTTVPVRGEKIQEYKKA